MEWMLMPYRRYADFDGRSQRKEYWMFVLFTTLVAIVCAIPMGIGIASMDNEAAGPSPMFFVGIIMLAVFGLASIIPSIAVQVRRFHDQDKSGWMVLLGFIPYVGGIIALVFMCLEGTRGPNRYGPDPKDPGAALIFA